VLALNKAPDVCSSLWRGSLSDRRTVPLDCAAVVKPENQINRTNRIDQAGGRFAAQREQAPSPQATSHKPQGMVRTRYLVIHNFFTNANHRLSFKQVRSICVNGSVDYGRFVANRFE
ncbi:MAG: hypothetical protein AAAB17_18215, partial [Pseudomonas sp.]